MSRWKNLERFVVPAVGFSLAAVSLLFAQEPAKARRPAAAETRAAAPAKAKGAEGTIATIVAAAPVPQVEAGIAAIRAAARDYQQAMREEDYKTASSFWNPSGDYIDSAGHKHNALEMFARRLAKVEAASGQPSKPSEKSGDEKPAADSGPALTTGSLRLITPDVAIEDGSWNLPAADSQRNAHSRFTAIWTHSQGKWRLDSLRESLASNESPAERLAALAWLVGEWEATHGAITLRMNCEWSPDKNFLIRELKAGPAADQLALLGTQRIGWDPISGRIKSWMFEANGGWGEGLWTQAGDAWAVRANMVHPDGARAAATTSYTPVGRDQLTLESTDVTVGGQPRPDVKLDFNRK